MGYDCEKALDYYEEQIDRLREFMKGRPLDQKKDLIEAISDYIVELEKEGKKKFKLNDWVVSLYDNSLIKLDSDTRVEQANSSPWKNRIRLATDDEVEENWWSKHNREVWELKKGDEIRNRSTGVRFDVFDVSSVGNVTLINVDLKSRSEDYGQNIKRVISVLDLRAKSLNYEVVCFTEDRKDL